MDGDQKPSATAMQAKSSKRHSPTSDAPSTAAINQDAALYQLQPMQNFQHFAQHNSHYQEATTTSTSGADCQQSCHTVQTSNASQKEIYQEFYLIWQSLAYQLQQAIAYLYHGHPMVILAPDPINDPSKPWDIVLEKARSLIDIADKVKEADIDTKVTELALRAWNKPIMLAFFKRMIAMVRSGENYGRLSDECPNHLLLPDADLLMRTFGLADQDKQQMIDPVGVHGSGALFRMTQDLNQMVALLNDCLTAITNTRIIFGFGSLPEEVRTPLRIAIEANQIRCREHIRVQPLLLFERYSALLSSMSHDVNGSREQKDLTLFRQYHFYLQGQVANAGIFSNSQFKNFMYYHGTEIDEAVLTRMADIFKPVADSDSDAPYRNMIEISQTLGVTSARNVPLRVKAQRICEKWRLFEFLKKEGKLEVKHFFVYSFYITLAEVVFKKMQALGQEQKDNAFQAHFAAVNSDSNQLTIARLRASQDAPMLHLASQWSLQWRFYLRTQKETLWHGLIMTLLNFQWDPAATTELLSAVLLRVRTYVMTITDLCDPLSEKETARLKAILELIDGRCHDAQVVADLAEHLMMPLTQTILAGERSDKTKEQLIPWILDNFVKPVILADFNKLQQRLQRPGGRASCELQALVPLISQLYANIQLWIQYCSAADDAYLHDPALKPMFDCIEQAQAYFKELLECRPNREENLSNNYADTLLDNFVYLHLLKGRLAVMYQQALIYVETYDGSNPRYAQLFQYIRVPLTTIEEIEEQDKEIGDRVLGVDLLIPYFKQAWRCYVRGVPERQLTALIQNDLINDLDKPSNPYGQLFNAVLMVDGKRQQNALIDEVVADVFTELFVMVRAGDINSFGLAYVKFIESYANHEQVGEFRMALFMFLSRMGFDKETTDVIQYYRSRKVGCSNKVDQLGQQITSFVGLSNKTVLLDYIDQYIEQEKTASAQTDNLSETDLPPEITKIQKIALQRLIVAFFADERGFIYRNHRLFLLCKLADKYPTGTAFHSEVKNLVMAFIDFYQTEIRLYDPTFKEAGSVKGFLQNTFYVRKDEDSPHMVQLTRLQREYIHNVKKSWSPLIQRLIHAFLPVAIEQEYFSRALSMFLPTSADVAPVDPVAQLRSIQRRVNTLEEIGYLRGCTFCTTEDAKKEIRGRFEEHIKKYLYTNPQCLLEGNPVSYAVMYLAWYYAPEDIQANLKAIRLRDIFIGRQAGFFELECYHEYQELKQILEPLKTVENPSIELKDNVCRAFSTWWGDNFDKKTFDESVPMQAIEWYIFKSAELNQDSIAYFLLTQLHLDRILPKKWQDKFSKRNGSQLIRQKMHVAFENNNLAEITAIYQELSTMSSTAHSDPDYEKLAECFYASLLSMMIKVVLYHRLKAEGFKKLEKQLAEKGASCHGILKLEDYKPLLHHIKSSHPDLHRVCSSWLKLGAKFPKNKIASEQTELSTVEQIELPADTTKFLTAPKYSGFNHYLAQVGFPAFQLFSIETYFSGLDFLNPELPPAENGSTPSLSPRLRSTSTPSLGQSSFSFLHSPAVTSTSTSAPASMPTLTPKGVTPNPSYSSTPTQ